MTGSDVERTGRTGRGKNKRFRGEGWELVGEDGDGGSTRKKKKKKGKGEENMRMEKGVGRGKRNDEQG